MERVKQCMTMDDLEDSDDCDGDPNFVVDNVEKSQVIQVYSCLFLFTAGVWSGGRS